MTLCNGQRGLKPSYRWYVVAILWWISFFNYADRQAVFSVFPLLSRELRLSNTELGLLGSSFAWVYGLCAPFAGVVVDRVRRKTAIVGGLHAWSLICLATASSRNLSHLIFFRAAEGLGETFYYPASTSLISDYHGIRTRSRALGVHQTSVYAGTIAGGFFAGLIGQHYGWRSSFIVFGCLGILLGLFISRFLIEPRRGASDAGSGPVCQAASRERRLSLAETLAVIWRTPVVRTLMLAFLCANFGALVLLSWTPTFLHDKFDFSLAMAGLNATVYPQVASMVGAVFGGWSADGLRKRMPGGRIIVQALGVLGVVPFAYLSGQLPSLPWTLTALTAWGLFKGFYDASIFASVFDLIPPETRGTTAGFMNMVGWLAGGAPAPIVIGYLADSYGLSAAISSTAIVYVAAALVLLLASAQVARPSAGLAGRVDDSAAR
jgi:MFS family permease